MKNVPPDQVEPPTDVEFYFSPCDALRSDASPRDHIQQYQKVEIITFLVLLSFVLVTWWRHIFYLCHSLLEGSLCFGRPPPQKKKQRRVAKKSALRGTLVAHILCPENGLQNRDHATDCLLRQDPKNGRKTRTTFLQFGPKVPQHFCCDPWRRPPRGGGPISSQPPRQTTRGSSISTWTRLPSECGILDLGDG